MQAALMAGALSDRLGWAEQLHHVPTLPLANTPLILHSINLLRSLGVTDLTVNINHGANNVIRLLQSVPQQDIRIRPSLEHHLLGSANILRRLTPRPVEPFLVMMGDIFLDRVDMAGLLETHHKSGAVVTLLACRQYNPGYHSYGVLSVNERYELESIAKETEVESNFLVNTGFYLFNPEVIDLVPADKPCQIGRDLLPDLIAHGHKVQVVDIESYFCRIQDYRQYWQLNIDLASSKVRPAYESLPGGEETTKNLMGTSIRLEGPVTMGVGCKIERDVTIQGPAIIGNYVHIKRGSRLKNTVILDHTTLGMATEFEDCVISGERVASIQREEIVTISNPVILCSNRTLPFFDKIEQLIHSCLALLILIAVSPLFLLLILAIKLESAGPVFYTQLRVGQRKNRGDPFFYPGEVFVFIKFRTMYTDADSRLKQLLEQNEYHSPTFVKLKNDPRVTRVGRFIRKTSLDELPQLINVIVGNMRLVGNRPLPLYEAYNLKESWQQLRFTAPAGMTGLWQISGRSDLSMEERIILDNYYAVSRTFWSDMKILFMTIPAVIFQSGAR
ncbi:MAG TPA: sugar transferase [Chloroflexia bacterium]|nr:sugar transferase [Chloroflexia bacterium]